MKNSTSTGSAVVTMSSTMLDPLAPVLEALLPRQVANDKVDRDAWLRARLTGITATEAKVLHKGSSRDKADVIKKKIEGDSFTGTKYTDWGSYREDFLLAQAAASEYGWLLHAPGNTRHLATPDGLRKTWDGFAVVECKTSKHDISFGSKKFTDYGYLWQILWQMYCADTDEAYYVFEQHDDDWTRWNNRPRDDQSRWAEFGPASVRVVIQHIVLTPELKSELDKMVAAADRALVRLDKRVADLRSELAAASDPETPGDTAAPADDAESNELHLATLALETQAKLYMRSLEREKALGDEKQTALAAALDLSVKRWGDEVDSHEFAPNPEEPETLFRVGYSPAGEKVATATDAEAAKAADPELWAKVDAARATFTALQDQWKAHEAGFTVTKTTPVKASVRVTKKKAGK